MWTGYFLIYFKKVLKSYKQFIQSKCVTRIKSWLLKSNIFYILVCRFIVKGLQCKSEMCEYKNHFQNVMVSKVKTNQKPGG